MKKLLALFTGLIIAAGASAQTERGNPAAAQSGKTTAVDRQAPINSDNANRQNQAKEPPESANIVDPDFQGSSKQETTATGQGQPTTATEKNAKAIKDESDVQHVEDKTKR